MGRQVLEFNSAPSGLPVLEIRECREVEHLLRWDALSNQWELAAQDRTPGFFSLPDPGMVMICQVVRGRALLFAQASEEEIVPNLLEEGHCACIYHPDDLDGKNQGYFLMGGSEGAVIKVWSVSQEAFSGESVLSGEVLELQEAA